MIQIDHDRIRWMMAAKAIGLSPAEEPAFIELCTAADAIRMESYLFIRLVGVDHQIAQLERRRDALLSLMHPSRRVR